MTDSLDALYLWELPCRSSSKLSHYKSLLMLTLTARQVFFWRCICAPAICFLLHIYIYINMHVCVFYAHRQVAHYLFILWLLSLLSWTVFIDMDNTKESLCSGEFPSQYLVLLCCHLLSTLRRTMKAKWDAPPLLFFNLSLYNITHHYVLNIWLMIFWFTVDNRSWWARCDVFECARHSCHCFKACCWKVDWKPRRCFLFRYTI